MNESQRQAELIASYKELLRAFLEKRPSGLRKRISDTIGTNRSFVSQITNPKYSVPIPAHYVHQIIAVCHLSTAERNEFVNAYLQAHPGQVELLNEPRNEDSSILLIDLSSVADEAQRLVIKQAVRALADAMIALSSGNGKGEGGVDL